MEFVQLRYLIAVAEAGNFTRASENCHVSQPSLSQQILNLEKELGHKLLHRLGRRAVPTEAGVVFLQRARRILQEADDAAKEMQDSNKIERSITIGIIPTLPPSLLPSMMALVKERHPELEIRAHEDFRDDLVAGVLDGKLDLAIVAPPVTDSRIAYETLFEEPLLLTMGKNHPLATKRTITIDDVRPHKFVMMGTRSTLAEEIRHFFDDKTLEPDITFQCAQTATVKALVAQGAGISILPQGSITPEDRTSLISRQLGDRPQKRVVGIVRHLMRYQTRGAEQFLKLLREHKRPL